MCQTLLWDGSSAGDTPKGTLVVYVSLGWHLNAGVVSFKCHGRKETVLQAFIPISQDRASREKGVAAGGQQKWVRHSQPGGGLGSGPLSRLQGRAVGVIIWGPGQQGKVAFAKEMANCHRSRVLERGSNLSGGFRNSVN